MNKLRHYMNMLLNCLAGASLLAMVLLTAWQVFTRYLLKNPSTWSEELVSYLFAFASLFGAAIVSGERNHMNIGVLVEKMNHKMQVFFGILSEVIAMLFSGAILIYGGIEISSLAMGQMTSSLHMPIGVFYIAMPVTGILIILYSILNIVGILRGDLTPLPTVEENEREEDK